MQSLIGRIVKYIGRVLLICILSLLLVGLIKYRGDVGAYVDFLNTRDRNVARNQLSVSQPSSFGYMFRGSEEERNETTESLTGDILTGEISTGLDAYDPSREDELNDSDTTFDEGDFGFQNDGSDDDTTTQEELLNLIKERELNN